MCGLEQAATEQSVVLDITPLPRLPAAQSLFIKKRRRPSKKLNQSSTVGNAWKQMARERGYIWVKCEMCVNSTDMTSVSVPSLNQTGPSESETYREGLLWWSRKLYYINQAQKLAMRRFSQSVATTEAIMKLHLWFNLLKSSAVD